MKISLRDAKLMYEGSSLLLGKELVYVQKIEEEHLFYYPVTGGEKGIHTMVHGFTFDSILHPINFRLGYFQNGKNATLLSRVAARQFKVGLTKANLQFSAPFEDEEIYIPLNSKAKAGWPILKGIAQLMTGEYPSFRKAVEKIKDGFHSVALDRQFAINFHGELFFRRDKVGSWDDERIHLDIENRYLSSVLGAPNDFE